MDIATMNKKLLQQVAEQRAENASVDALWISVDMQVGNEQGAMHRARLMADMTVHGLETLAEASFQIMHHGDLDELDSEYDISGYEAYLHEQPRTARVMVLHEVSVPEKWRGNGLGTVMLEQLPITMREFIDKVVVWPWRNPQDANRDEEIPRLATMARRAGYRPALRAGEFNLLELALRPTNYTKHLDRTLETLERLGLDDEGYAE
jgi:GNAT superfamily N-acetyltransferase